MSESFKYSLDAPLDEPSDVAPPELSDEEFERQEELYEREEERQFREDVREFAEEKGIFAVMDFYGADERTIQEWGLGDFLDDDSDDDGLDDEDWEDES